MKRRYNSEEVKNNSINGRPSFFFTTTVQNSTQTGNTGSPLKKKKEDDFIRKSELIQIEDNFIQESELIEKDYSENILCSNKHFSLQHENHNETEEFHQAKEDDFPQENELIQKNYPGSIVCTKKYFSRYENPDDIEEFRETLENFTFKKIEEAMEEICEIKEFEDYEKTEITEPPSMKEIRDDIMDEENLYSFRY